MSSQIPSLENVVADLAPGKALDLACGSGRHSRWLTTHGWDVTSVDLVPAWGSVIQADLERGESVIETAAWDLIVCWLYWQENLLPEIAGGARPGGVVALAGKTSGRFATSLARYRAVFGQWTELVSGENESFAFLIARRGEELID